MAGTFNFTFKVPGDSSQTPLSSTSGTLTPGATVVTAAQSTAVPTTLPALQPFDLFPTRIWQARLAPLIPHLEQWVTATLAMRAASAGPAGRTNRQG